MIRPPWQVEGYEAPTDADKVVPEGETAVVDLRALTNFIGYVGELTDLLAQVYGGKAEASELSARLSDRMDPDGSLAEKIRGLTAEAWKRENAAVPRWNTADLGMDDDA